MHRDILTPAQQSALEILGGLEILSSFYLAGGTGLALHLGHRESIDFDFFRTEPFEPQWLLGQLPAPPPLRVLQEAANTLTVTFHEVKTSFFAYPHARLEPTTAAELPVAVANVPDIAAMKLAAIGGRGSRKDFVDLYVISHECFPLREAVDHLQARFANQQYDLYHILRSLTYFEDAEAEPMPRLYRDISWEQIRSFFLREAVRLRQ